MSLAQLAFVSVLVFNLSSAVRTSSHSSIASYEEFRKAFGVERDHEDMASYYARVALFQQRQEEVREHNARPGSRWVAAVNKFADYTRDEFHAMLGQQRLRRAPRASSSSFLELRPSNEVAQSVDWNAKVNVSAKNQGGCGSCWAVASAGALEAHAAIAGQPIPDVSYEQLVDCTPNPQECGGQGGCKGATAELALEYTHLHGLVGKADYKGYQSGGDGKCKPAQHPILSTQGFERLPENKLQPLLEALSTHGPVVVSADASGWSSYSSGVFDSCEKDAIINHAILCMGYGTDEGHKSDYWLIRNSWGPEWGEKGHIRMLRHATDAEYCGKDRKPLDGVGCKGGPAELPVCGMCGVLADSAYPTGVQKL